MFGVRRSRSGFLFYVLGSMFSMRASRSSARAKHASRTMNRERRTGTSNRNLEHRTPNS